MSPSFGALGNICQPLSGSSVLQICISRTARDVRAASEQLYLEKASRNLLNKLLHGENLSEDACRPDNGFEECRKRKGC